MKRAATGSATPSGAVSARGALEGIWRLAAGEPAALERIELTGGEPALPSVFPVGTAASACIAAAGLAASELWRLRSGTAQPVRVAMRDAAIAYRSEHYLRVDGAPVAGPDRARSYFRDASGRWMQLHMGYAHHRDGILRELGSRDDEAAIARAMAGRDAFELEATLAGQGLPGYALRTPAEWAPHPQAAALAAVPVLELVRIGDAAPRPLPPGARPLAGVRVADLTRVIAGPVCGRTLAAHGADVLRIHPPHLSEIPVLAMDGGRGKRCAHVDLRDPAGRRSFDALVDAADVFVQGFRPGGVASLGYGPEAVAERRPGIVYVTLNAWGETGPWALRHGFDSLVQTATGIVAEGSVARGVDEPAPLPCQALDHSTGYLAAVGAMMGLARRATEGGSWLVRVSLAATGRWLGALGRIDGLAAPDPDLDAVADRLELRPTPFGEMTSVRCAEELPATPPAFSLPPAPLGSHPCEWT